MGLRRSRLVVLATVSFITLSFSGSASGEETTTTTSSTTTTTTTTTTSTTTTTIVASSEWRFSGSGSVLLLDRSENQLQVRGFGTIVRGDGGCGRQSSALVSYSISPDDGYGRGQGITSFAYGSWAPCSPLNFPFEAVAFNGLKSGTTYTICLSVSHGTYGSVSACGSWTTLGDSTSSTTSSTSTTVASGSSTSSSTTSTTVASGGYMVLLDTQRRAIDIWTRSQYDTFDPYQLPRGGCGCFTWVATGTAPQIGMIYDGSRGFAWPTTTTSSTSTVPESGATPVPDSGVTTVPESETTTTIAPGSTSIPPEVSSPSTSGASSVSTTTVAPVPPGTGEAEVDGTSVAVETSVDKDAGSVTIVAGDVEASITGGQAPAADSDAPENALVFEAGSEVSVAASGFQPNSEAEVIVYSEPTNLGRVKVDIDGTITAQVTLPSNLKTGNHTLVINGVNAENQPISVKFGLIVYGTESVTPIWIWMLVSALTLTLLLSVWLNIRSRQRALI